MKPHNVKKTILIIDDDQLLCDVVSCHLNNNRIEVLTANTGSAGIGICSKRMVDVVLLDQKLPDGKGLDLCKNILACNDQVKIIFITAYPSLKNAISAIKVGAYDYLLKPFDLEDLDLAVDHALTTLDLEKVEQIQNYKSDKEKEETVLIGRHGGMLEIQRIAKMAASVKAPVLITGETGVGKNVVSKTIHYMSSAKRTAFIGVNCAAIPDNLIEAELFGFEKGAFTGAFSAKKGLFEMAEGGTLFLDEIGTLLLHLQSKLLSVLDDKSIRRLGSESVRPVDVRIVAATNRDIEKGVKDGSFREDLYYRINVIRIHIPPLRERLKDIPDLCRFFISRIVPDSDVEMPDSETARLMGYHWPGNVRELKNVIERSIILRQGTVLRPSELLAGEKLNRSLSLPPHETAEAQEVLSLSEVQKQHIRYALRKFAGNHTRAARALGISRSTLNRKLKVYGVH